MQVSLQKCLYISSSSYCHCYLLDSWHSSRFFVSKNVWFTTLVNSSVSKVRFRTFCVHFHYLWFIQFIVCFSLWQSQEAFCQIWNSMSDFEQKKKILSILWNCRIMSWRGNYDGVPPRSNYNDFRWWIITYRETW